MNNNQLNNDITNEIVRLNKSITNKVRLIKENLTKLQNDILLMSHHMGTYKELHRDNSNSLLAVILEETPLHTKTRQQHYSFINNRKVIDRQFLERLDIIDKPIRTIQPNTKPIKNTTPLHIVGTLCESVRSIKIMSAMEQEIIKDMITKLESEL